MAWNIIYFIIAIAAAVVGIWNLAQRKFVFLSIACFMFFLVVLFMFLLGSTGIADLVIIPGTSLANLVLFGVIPIFLILAFFTRNSR
jgi:hypothetical protein